MAAMQGYPMAQYPAQYGAPVPFPPSPVGYQASPMANQVPMYSMPPQLAGMPIGPFFDPAAEARSHGQYVDGFCSCCNDIGICCQFMCYPGCLIREILNRLPLNVRSFTMISDPNTAYCLANICPMTICCMASGIDKAVASKYNIPPTNCLVSYYCPLCSITRSARHLKIAQGF